MRRTVILAAAITCVLCASFSPPVRAREPLEATTNFLAKPWAIDVALGLGAPFGLVGLQGTRQIAPWLAVSAGAGFNNRGPQGNVMARFQSSSESAAFGLGTGFSLGPYRWTENFLGAPIGDGTANKSAGAAAWLNGELFAAYQGEGGFRTSGFLGVGTIMNRGALDCESGHRDHCEADHSGDGFYVLYLGFSLGYAF